MEILVNVGKNLSFTFGVEHYSLKRTDRAFGHAAPVKPAAPRALIPRTRTFDGSLGEVALVVEFLCVLEEFLKRSWYQASNQRQQEWVQKARLPWGIPGKTENPSTEVQIRKSRRWWVEVTHLGHARSTKESSPPCPGHWYSRDCFPQEALVFGEDESTIWRTRSCGFPKPEETEVAKTKSAWVKDSGHTLELRGGRFFPTHTNSGCVCR